MPLWFLDPALVFLFVLVAIALAAPRYGVDSRGLRPGEGPRRRGPTPASDLRALVRAIAARMERAAVRPERPSAPRVGR